MKKEVKKPQSVRFTNWTKDKFSHKWDNVEYTFDAGESTQLQDYLAHHFAHHLAQREINKKNLLMSDLKFKEFYDKCFTEEPVSAETEEKLEMEIEKIKEEDKVKKEKPEKIEKTKSSSKPEDDFAGNKNEATK